MEHPPPVPLDALSLRVGLAVLINGVGVGVNWLHTGTQVSPTQSVKVLLLSHSL